jgi:SAM-dependent methyltransferase/uncharacterized protein YbaR (Trm112 family)
MNAAQDSKIPERIRSSLRCPRCSAALQRVNQHLHCRGSSCSAIFPIIDGIPVLLNDQNSLFSTDTIVRQHRVAKLLQRQPQTQPGLVNRLINSLTNHSPDISKNIHAEENYRKFSELVSGLSDQPAVLVVGGSVPGQGMEALHNQPHITLVESDVVFGPRTAIFFDAHDIPFIDHTFDGVIIQAVLEHVLDPYRCVDEIHRVLKEQGIVYAETAFMQQVHGGRYDFLRFTHSGHRRLFRKFKEIESGAACGPGMALAWSYQYFLVSFFESKRSKQVARFFASLTSFFLKYFDAALVNKPGALDAASAFYFLGQKTEFMLQDNELKSYYRGGQLG